VRRPRGTLGGTPIGDVAVEDDATVDDADAVEDEDVGNW
jgi:hypothetical protein